MKSARRIRFTGATWLLVLFGASWLLIYKLWNGTDFNGVVASIRDRGSLVCTFRCLGVVPFFPFFVACIRLLLIGLLSITLLTALAKTMSRIRRTQKYIRTVEKRVVRETRLFPDLNSVRVFADPKPLAFTAGFLRPKIYLSRALLENLGPSEQRAVVLHESHHLKKRDPLRSLLTSFLADFLRFFPISYFLKKSWLLTAELKADSHCVGHGVEPLDIASVLLNVLSVENVNAAWFFDQNRERIMFLLGKPFRAAPAISKVIVSSVLFIALTFISLAPMRNGAAAVVPRHENVCHMNQSHS